MDYHYPEDPNAQKIVILPNGMLESCARVDTSTELWWIHPSGEVWEEMRRGDILEQFPERIDPDPDPRSPDNYAFYYRE